MPYFTQFMWMQRMEHNFVGLPAFLLILVPSGAIYLPLLLSLGVLFSNIEERGWGGRQREEN